MNEVLKPYLISLIIGIGIGVIYATLKIRSPAPPLVALVGLLGMTIGELLPQWIANRSMH